MTSTNTPFNQYSLNSLESWLKSLGAKKDDENLSKWHLKLSNWDATIYFDQEDLRVVWNSEGVLTTRLFSYFLNRSDIESAILEGP